MYVPPHLYGQLVQHHDGTEVVLSLPYLSDFIDIIRTHCLRQDTNIKETKAAIWAIVSAPLIIIIIIITTFQFSTRLCVVMFNTG